MDFIFICYLIVIGATAVVIAEEVFLLYSDAYVQRTVGTMSIDGVRTEYCFSPNTFISPRGLAYDQDSNYVYVVDNNIGVYKFMLDRTSVPEQIFNVTRASLYSIALDEEGHMFISDDNNDVIYRVNINGTDLITWVTDVKVLYGLIVDKNESYLIWGNVNTWNIERAPLDDPHSKEIIIRSSAQPHGLHLDESTNKLFWCQSTRTVLMANTDGTDQQLLIELDNIYLRYIAGFGDHLYLTGSRGQYYMVYDIYNGSYTEIFNFTTPKVFGLAVASGHNAADACHVTCHNGGSFVKSSRACDCFNLWSGRECEECNSSCRNGGTLDNNSCTCECILRWGGDRCDNCNVVCENGGTVSNDNCTCDCLLHWTGEKCGVFEPPSSDLIYTRVNSAWPSFGPAVGGTLITVNGENLPDGYHVSISIDDVICDTILQNTTTVIGLTQGLTAATTELIERDLPVSLRAYDKVVVNSTRVFTYKQNPMISKVYPKESIIKGGTLLTVEGENLESVALILMETTMVLKTLKTVGSLVYNEKKTVYNTECKLANKTQMYCPTPILDIPPGFLNSTVQSTPVKRDIYRHEKIREYVLFRNTQTKGTTALRRPMRLKRDTAKVEFSNNGDILEFYIGFRLDGVQDYENFTTIDIYTEPTFDFVTEAFAFVEGQRLSFYGNNLDVGISVSDYGVTVGTASCTELELLFNILSCYPPQSKPVIDANQTGMDPEKIIQVGLNSQHLAGYLSYPNPNNGTSQKLSLHIIIPATVIPSIIIIAAVAVLCTTKRRLWMFKGKNGETVQHKMNNEALSENMKTENMRSQQDLS